MSFLSDCEAVPELAGASKPGLQALNAQDLAHVGKRQQTVLTTSIDVDSACRASQPNAARWDYGVGERRNRQEMLHWIEVHPASGDNSIAQMGAKLKWLRGWLHGKALADRERQVVWVASGKSAFNARDPRLKALARAGLRFAGGHFSI